MEEVGMMTFKTKWNAKKGSQVCKFDLSVFPVIRLDKDEYKVGKKYRIVLVNKNDVPIREYGVAEIKSKKTFYLSKVNDEIALVDSGYGKDEFIEIVEKMYKGKGVNFRRDMLAMLFFKYVENDLFQNADLVEDKGYPAEWDDIKEVNNGN